MEILYMAKQFGKNDLSFYRAIVFTSMFNIINFYMFGFGVYPINDAIITEPHPTQAAQIVRQRCKRVVNHFICILSTPVNFFGNSLLDGFVKFFEGLLGVGQECYFIHNSLLREPQLLPLPAISSRLALRIFFINSGS